MKKRYCAFLQSPLGFIELRSTGTSLTYVSFVAEKSVESDFQPEVLARAKKELQEYFSGLRRKFSVRTKYEGTLFQRKIWKQVKRIEFGDTVSYGDIAARLGLKNGSRAVGHANSKNPLAIIVPCHRVIAEDGKLMGYAGGIARKQWLLDMEGNISGKNLTLF